MGDGKRQESSPTGHRRRGTSWVMVRDKSQVLLHGYRRRGTSLVMVRDKSQVLLAIDGEGHHG